MMIGVNQLTLFLLSELSDLRSSHYCPKMALPQSISIITNISSMILKISDYYLVNVYYKVICNNNNNMI